MSKRGAAEGVAFGESRGGEVDAPEQLARLKHVLVVAGDEIERRDFALAFAAWPKRVGALKRRGERDHGACGQRHADVSADGRRVIDLERHEKRVAAQLEKRRSGPCGGSREALELGDGAGRRDFQSVSVGLERGPAERLEVDQGVGFDLRRRVEPRSAGKPGIAVVPLGNLVEGFRPLDLGNGVQIHGLSLMIPTPSGGANMP